MTITFYRIRHKPTGLFLKTPKGNSPAKLTETSGNVYTRKPTIKQFFSNNPPSPRRFKNDGNWVECNYTDFEIVVYRADEIYSYEEGKCK